MELSDAIYGRRSTRAFKERLVDRSILEQLIEAAIQAPSAINEQPWEFTVIRNRSLLARLSAAAKDYALQPAKGNAFSIALQKHLEDPEFDIFYHAPALIVISVDSANWAIEDAALAAQNLMLAAYAHGLGSCWIGFAQRWLQTESGRRMIDLPRDFMPVAPIIVGYPAAKPPLVPRKPARSRWLD